MWRCWTAPKPHANARTVVPLFLLSCYPLGAHQGAYGAAAGLCRCAGQAAHRTGAAGQGVRQGHGLGAVAQNVLPEHSPLGARLLSIYCLLTLQYCVVRSTPSWDCAALSRWCWGALALRRCQGHRLSRSRCNMRTRASHGDACTWRKRRGTLLPSCYRQPRGRPG